MSDSEGWEDEEHLDSDIGGSSVKSKRELEEEGLNLFEDGIPVDNKGASIDYVGVVYSVEGDPDISAMVKDDATNVSDFAVLRCDGVVRRALAVSREEGTGNIDFHLLSIDEEEAKLLSDTKKHSIKPAWQRWVSAANKEKHPSTGPAVDVELFGGEDGCIYLTPGLVARRKKPSARKPPPKKPDASQGGPKEDKEGTPPEEPRPEPVKKALAAKRAPLPKKPAEKVLPVKKRAVLEPVDEPPKKKAHTIRISMEFESMEDMRRVLFK